MTDEELKGVINATVEKTINEMLTYLKKNKMLKEPEDIIYFDATELLNAYYRNDKENMEITYAIQGLSFDTYYRIIPLYFEEGKTIEQIAEILDVDARTIARNKKRLLLSIYNEIV